MNKKQSFLLTSLRCVWLLFAAIGMFLFLFLLYLVQFKTPVTDDYIAKNDVIFVQENSFAELIEKKMQTDPLRIASVVTTMTPYFVFPLDLAGYAYSIVSILIVLLASFFIVSQVYKLFNVKLNMYMISVWSCILFGLQAAFLYTTYEVFFWWPGFVVHYIGFGLVLTCIYLMQIQNKKRYNVVSSIILVLVAALAASFSEISAAFLFLYSIVLCVRTLMQRQGIKWNILFVFFGACIGALQYMVLRGASARVEREGLQVFSWSQKLIDFVQFGIRDLFFWFSNAGTWIAFILGVGAGIYFYVHQQKKVVSAIKQLKQEFFLIAAMYFCILLGVSIYLEYTTQVLRMYTPFLVVSWLFVWSVGVQFAFWYVGQLSSSKRLKLSVQMTSILLIFSFTYPIIYSINNPMASFQLSSTFVSNMRDTVQWNEELVKKMQTSKVVEIERQAPLAILNPILEDPNYWLNLELRKYFRVDEVRLKSNPDSNHNTFIDQ